MKKLSVNQIENTNGGACGFFWCRYTKDRPVNGKPGCFSHTESFRLFWLDTGISREVETGTC